MVTMAPTVRPRAARATHATQCNPMQRGGAICLTQTDRPRK